MLKPCRRIARSGWATRALPLLSALCFGLITMSVSSRAQAYTWMVKHGYANCGACHADPSGGELLTVYGRAMSEAFLSSKFGGSSDGGEEAADSDSEAKEEEESRWMRRQMAKARSRGRPEAREAFQEAR